MSDLVLVFGLAHTEAAGFRKLTRRFASPSGADIRIGCELGPKSSLAAMLGTRTVAMPRLSRALRTGACATARDHATLASVAARVRGNIVRLDHIGVTLPARGLTPHRRRALFRELQKLGEVRIHPGHADWRFLYPSLGGRTRPPAMFELAIDEHAGAAALQLDVETNLTLEALKAKFAPHERVDVPGLSGFALSVPVQHARGAPCVRVDLRARPETGMRLHRWLAMHSPRALSPNMIAARHPD